MAVEAGKNRKVNFIRGAAAVGTVAGLGLLLWGGHISQPSNYEMAHHIPHPVEGVPLLLMGAGTTLTVTSVGALLFAGRILE